MNGILPFDYIEKPNVTIYNVRASWFDDKNIYAHPLYQKNTYGNRKRGEIKFSKNNNDDIEKIKLRPPLLIYKAREYYKDIYYKIPQEWQNLARVLEGIVGINNLSIIGSWLIGFNGKDVDFAIYGLDSFKKLSRNLAKLRKVSETIHPPIEYRGPILKSYQYLDQKHNSCDKFVLRRFYLNPKGAKEGSTLRFVLKQEEMPPNPYKLKTIKKNVEIKGAVNKGDGSHFYPRFFTVKGNGRKYQVISILHPHQSAVENGDYISIRGELKEDNVILIDNPSKQGIYIS